MRQPEEKQSSLQSHRSRQKRIGPWQLAITVLAVGIGILVDQLFYTNVLATVLKFWPLLLIIIGVELIFRQLFQTSENSPGWKLDASSLILMVVILMGANVYQAFSNGNIMELVTNRLYKGPVQFVTVMEKDLEVADMKTLRLTNDFGKVMVEGAADGRFHIRVDGNVKADSKQEAQQRAKDIEVSVEQGQETSIEIRDNYNKARDLTLYVMVPENTEIISEVKAGVTDIKKVRKADVKSDAGKVTVSDITEQLKVSSNAGAIEATNISNTTLRSNVGMITVSGSVQGTLDVGNDAGKINVSSDVVLNGPWQLHSDLGAVMIHIPKESQVTLTASTKLGSITGNELEVERSGASVKTVKTLGDGTFPIQVSTDLGSITFDATR
ncbi:MULTISPECIES: DUF4097 family beta strand repeat-containing protein [Brevibacillus]|uniref:DUF4097 family beta strand repeat-containing protein n=1 Tax=Brevibacillus TaxID=55080 RepID=UPI0003B184F6|nr:MULTISPECIES: DUF4097 family beta strand repeat-containing protein [Brevibacillus]AUM64829.1 hypothetical protein C0R09_09970 [Brevibacillus laterosporus]AYK07827.1 hypothetical protein D8Z77_16425 [Brevibacillus laterosporus]ERM20140.1 hypothetical protein P615_07625 [Brevibacillus laterosporus PE36]MBA4534027.1 DUF4097 family beta strand repeat protein [Brevibacillus halotolerans]PCN43709.1 hypothetical protein B9C88_13190 [Brevibacillus laterosporus]